MRIGFVTLFPSVLQPFLSSSILGRAIQSGLVRVDVANPRDFTYDRNSKVDDRPFGGAPGMLMKAEPVTLALESLGQQDAVIITDPAAPLFTQSDAVAFSKKQSLTFLCGHYEGIDNRVRENVTTHAFSIGDYILTNGELPALCMADAVIRHIPGVLGNADSLIADSFSARKLSAPNYTHPADWRGHLVPEVLRSGDHQAIAAWIANQENELTRRFRPELMGETDVP